MKMCALALLVVLVALSVSAHTYYVATGGSDTNPGTFDSSYATIGKATGQAVAGDTIYVRGGTYAVTTTISISRSGVAGNLCNLLAYPGERVLLDCSGMAINSSNRGIKLNGSYWHIKGFDIYHAGDNGIIINGSNNIVEFCSFSENSDTGMQLAAGASYNQIINCDSYNNVDPSQGNADGFAPKLDVGTGNYFYGCRSWQNSDDGWDGYMRPSNGVTTTIENCWSFMNGYLKNGSVSSGNGNGFKMGGSDSTNLEHNMILKNCLSFDNHSKGFDQNNNRGSMTLDNCTSFRNSRNYSIILPLDSGKVASLTNCVALGAFGTFGTFVVQTTDSWLPPFTVDTSDFASIDSTGVRGPRKPDGSLPDVAFMHLAPGSDLLNAGTDVGLPFTGSAPDLGAFQLNPPPAAKLVAFAATILNGVSVRLGWTTISETGVGSFQVQRRAAADSVWADFPNDSVAGQGTSLSLHQYAVIDSNVGAGAWVYRIKQTNLDSSIAFSGELPVTLGTVTGVKAEAVPTRFALLQNYPNPFNPSTRISFSVDRTEKATLEVYNVLGQKVATLFDGVAVPGSVYAVRFDGARLASGVYFYRLRTAARELTKKLLLLR